MTADPHIEAIRQYVDFALTQLLDLRPDMERATEALDVFIAIKHVAARLEAAERALAQIEDDHDIACQELGAEHRREIALEVAAREAVERDLADTRKALAEAAHDSMHLFAMIDRETWRAQGAEWMGQYEGDKWAEDQQEAIKRWAALAAAQQPPAEGNAHDIPSTP